MINILVTGMLSEAGGVENYVRNIVLASDKDKVTFDFLVKGQDRILYEEEISGFYGGNRNHFFYITKLKENLPKAVSQVKAVYNQRTYDIVYINTLYASNMLYAAPFISKPRTKIITHSHWGGELKLNSGFLSNIPFRRYSNKHSDFKIACSLKAAEWLYGYDTARSGQVYILKNGIDISRFTYSSQARRDIHRKYNLNDEAILIGHIGRLTQIKNQSFLIDILNVMMSRNTNTYLLLVGGGVDKDLLLRKVKDNGLENHVIMPGVVSDTESYYSAFDAFVMPSFHEGLPLAGVEAQCEGLPCFFSDRIDSQILITDRARMLHLDTHNQAEWADIILNACETRASDRELYSEIVRSKGYDIKDVYRELEEIFMTLAKQ